MSQCHTDLSQSANECSHISQGFPPFHKPVASDQPGQTQWGLRSLTTDEDFTPLDTSPFGTTTPLH